MEAIKENSIIRGNNTLAKLLNVSTMTIGKWKREGRLNFTQIGRVVMYDTDNLFKEQRKSSPRKK